MSSLFDPIPESETDEWQNKCVDGRALKEGMDAAMGISIQHGLFSEKLTPIEVYLVTLMQEITKLRTSKQDKYGFVCVRCKDLHNISGGDVVGKRTDGTLEIACWKCIEKGAL